MGKSFSSGQRPFRKRFQLHRSCRAPPGYWNSSLEPLATVFPPMNIVPSHLRRGPQDDI